jgi:hypothetical protein
MGFATGAQVHGVLYQLDLSHIFSSEIEGYTKNIDVL